MDKELSLWIVSDLHLESTRGWDLPSRDARPSFDAMIVAGDLIPGMERGVRWLQQRVADKPVLYIAGNHEFYGRDIDRTVDKARETAAGTNVHVLQNDSIEINGVLFVGATLWADFNLFGNQEKAMRYAADQMNDYRKIRKRRYAERLRPADTLARHGQAREFIQQVTASSTARRKIVISHHGSVRQATRKGAEHDIISAAYTSDCSDLLANVDLWIYGHTHESRDFTIDGTRIVTNAKGYGPWPPRETAWENKLFNPKCVVEI